MQTYEQLRRGELRGSARLTLSENLTNFPREIFELADTLEILDLSGNQLRTLPDDLPCLHKLRIIFCSNNQFTKLPEVLGRCPELSMIGFKANQITEVPASALPAKLRWLILTDNLVQSLPDEIGQCLSLQKLMLAGNKLAQLPVALTGCRGLELLRIAANDLQEFPRFLLTMPKLSWLAYGGNPFTLALEKNILNQKTLPLVRWPDLEVLELLGQGASGQIYRARHIAENKQTEDVALKIFKASVTSDGLPSSELAANIAAGHHPNLTEIKGRLINHPENKQGLLMSLLNSDFKNMAKPPSFESCTRDVYDKGISFDGSSTLKIAMSIAQAIAHLHQRAVMHGDLYAHNILLQARGEVVFGDYGAASFFNFDTETTHALQRMEVRAYGYLLEELTERTRVDQSEPAVLEALNKLKIECLNDEIRVRPLFDQVVDTLSNL